ncbi:MAG TPA: hypothetical protein VHK22_07410 [Gaiellaceae bacterium]|nr:hypothetical protein [Gaiellaceae bacterium]
MRRAMLLAAASILLGLLAGCGGREDGSGEAAASPPSGPPLVQGLARTTTVVDLDTLAADALEPASLGRLLDEAGYTIGLEEEYSGRTKLYAHVVSRRLEFARVDGAARYVAWLRSNASDILGTARPVAGFDAGQDGFLTRDWGCGCHSDLPTFLAAWREGSIVRTLLADGPGVDRKRFVALARGLA